MKKILIKYNHKQLRRVTLKQILPDSADFQQIKSFRQKKKHGKNHKTNLVQPLSQKLKEMLLALIGLGAS